MDSHGFITQQDKLEFRQIILGFIKNVIDLTLRVVPKEHKLEFTETYSDSIRSLSDVLLPFYDDNMEKAYKDYEDKFNDLDNGKFKGSKVEFLRRVHRELFRQLNLLLGRKDYLKKAIYVEGMDEDDVVELT